MKCTYCLNGELIYQDTVDGDALHEINLLDNATIQIYQCNNEECNATGYIVLD